MINFDKYYYFPAKEVEHISIGENSGLDAYPFWLTVYLRSGRSLGVNYKTEAARDKAKISLVARIDNELIGTDGGSNTQLKICAIAENLQRMEKRQLRIARMVKRLQVAAEDETTDGEDL